MLHKKKPYVDGSVYEVIDTVNRIMEYFLNVKNSMKGLRVGPWLILQFREYLFRDMYERATAMIFFIYNSFYLYTMLLKTAPGI